MPQQIQIALDPDLGLDPETFIAEWNGRSQSSTLGQLHLDTAKSVTFFDPTLVTLVLQTAVAIATTVLTDQIKEYLKEKLAAQQAAPKAEVIEIQQPDGKTIIIIRKE